MKLEHALAYFQHKPKVKHTTFLEDGNTREIITEIESISFECASFKDGMDYYFPDPIDNECKFQLILKPLSDLIDNILEDGNDTNYELSLQLSDLLNTHDCSHFVKALIEKNYYAVDVRLWTDIEEWLYKNHFDWKYNLIEKGEAIDINTLNTKL